MRTEETEMEYNLLFESGLICSASLSHGCGTAIPRLQSFIAEFNISLSNIRGTGQYLMLPTPSTSSLVLAINGSGTNGL